MKKLKKETNDYAIKGIRNLSKLKKEYKVMKYRILRYIRNLFDLEEGDYYKPVRVGNSKSESKN